MDTTNYTLRPYQKATVDSVVAKLKEQPRVLAQLPTGAGKTIIFSHIIRKYLQEFEKMRILVLVHREILVIQNADKLSKVWPAGRIGIACAAASRDINTTAPVVFASIQTIANRLDNLRAFHLVVIDEAHRLPPIGDGSQYEKVLKRLELYYPSLRVFGLTATPFRHNHGPIYGKKYKRLSDNEPMRNWFPSLDHSSSILDLQGQKIDEENPDAPYLCQLRAFVEDKDIIAELTGVKTTAGEYNQHALSDVMRGARHIKSAVHAYQEHGAGRTRCVVFGVDIAHATDLVTAFRDAGIMAECVHSKMPLDERRRNLEAFEAGALPVIINVGVLVEGWDCRGVDMGIMARPTLSAALYVQMIGRGLRTFPGKSDFLLIDLAGNINRHGPPWEPQMPDYSRPGKPRDPKTMPDPKCPICGRENSPGSWTCAECGAILRVKEDVTQAAPVKLREIDFAAAAPAPVTPSVARGKVVAWSASKYQPMNGKPPCLRVDVAVKIDEMTVPVTASHFYRFDGPGGSFGLRWWERMLKQDRVCGKCLKSNDFAATRCWACGTEIFRGFWNAEERPKPTTVDEAVSRKAEIVVPTELRVWKDGKYWRVQGW